MNSSKIDILLSFIDKLLPLSELFSAQKRKFIDSLRQFTDLIILCLERLHIPTTFTHFTYWNAQSSTEPNKTLIKLRTITSSKNSIQLCKF